MDRRAEATKAFYAQLTPEQKKTFDAETARMGHGHMHREGGEHPHGGPAK
jgi:Spy/CpxP family protein refolding chaperone